MTRFREAAQLILISSIISFLISCGSSDNSTKPDQTNSTSTKKSSLRVDSDGDGVPDYLDRCPDLKGSKDNNGCPFVDSDKDGIPDEKDKCPNQPETVNGYLDDDGCPDVAPPSVEEKKEEPVQHDSVKTAIVTPPVATPPVVLESPKIPDTKPTASNLIQPIKMNFPDGSTTMKREQVEALLSVVKSMGQKSAKTTVEISVYCWETADASKNLKLAEKRAGLISKFLAQNGLKSGRVSVKSFSAKPNSSVSGNQYYEAKYSE